VTDHEIGDENEFSPHSHASAAGDKVSQIRLPRSRTRGGTGRQRGRVLEGTLPKPKVLSIRVIWSRQPLKGRSGGVRRKFHERKESTSGNKKTLGAVLPAMGGKAASKDLQKPRLLVDLQVLD